MIYLDYSATTPVNEQVLDSFYRASKDYVGNPNSLHRLGLESKKLIDAATEQIARILKIKANEIIYTSGASESNNTAIKGVCFKYQNRGKHVITTELEHSSVIAPCAYLQNLGFEVDFVKIDDNGLVDMEDLKRLIRNDTILVSIASVNSEVGVSQPINKIADLVKKQNSKTIFHSDMTQSIGKEQVDLSNIDLVSITSQKFYGLKGSGLLIKKENIIIEPLIHGGKSTTIYRSGTPAVGLIVATSKALRLMYEDLDKKIDYVHELNVYLRDKLMEIAKVHINSTKYSVPHILNISIKNIKPETMQHALEMEDIYISTQTACSTGTISKAVYAITKNKEYAKSSVRISLSHLTTKKELDTFVEVLKEKIVGLNI